jgi:NAD(P)-dependent dehydrogenase (short-subunit alcohol dehydrogenase family)
VATDGNSRTRAEQRRPVASLTGRLAVVTGATGGIGQALAEAYAKAGADLLLVGRDRKRLQAMAGRPVFIGRQITTVPLDLSEPHRLPELRAALCAGDGRFPDILINNAGIGQGGNPRPIHTLLDVTSEFWDGMFATNVRGPFLLMQALIPEMLRGGTGSIVNITSRLAVRPVCASAPYGPTKAALDQMTRVVAQEFAANGIRANLLHPGGPIRTGIFTDDWPIPVDSEVAEASIMGPPAVWLSTPAAAGVNGVTINARTWQDIADRSDS